ncbi:hypothetical protein CLOM_g4419 [Closterium sp. NIES-68]|nr:hypothetical protein CLOM_g4419 [Closterium sp. NIES-68]GJP76290.1 hypothetical protein CLOP_g6664 [Closterium sp. NIES-67]GJP82217.1 hypothetical protein CLOP_g12455 [Closterium sp. NIES-67]
MSSNGSWWGGGRWSTDSESKGKGEEVPDHLMPWPGGVNLLACLREMLLGQPCYRPPTHAAPTPAARAARTAGAQRCGPSPGGSRVCGSPRCGRAEGGAVRLRSCAGCSRVAYCRRECQKAHWPSHKLTCPGRASGKAPGKGKGNGK